VPDLVLTRRFAAPRERVFAAWTHPELLRRWWAAVGGWSTSRAEVDLRPEGRYRLSMRNPDEEAEYTVAGEYVEVIPPERLVYTWTWEGDAEIMAGSGGTVVEVDFVEAADGATEVRVIHRGFGAEAVRDLHGEGWTGCLDNLDRALA
jgi:uncharacterized protein YndB with AHSA1/START domain